MYTRVLVAINDVSQSQAVLDLVKDIAAEGVTEVRALHLRLHELSGYRWYSRETRNEASFVAEAATFELRMAGLAAGGGVRYAAVDRVAEAILAEADEFKANLIVLGGPKRGEVLTRLFGSVTLRVVGRARCPVLVAPRRRRARQAAARNASAPELSS
jgi:nucleotide-binding universal stress UspA family protein